MSLFVPVPGGFQWSVSNVAAGTQPGINVGTSFTCAQNAMGSEVSLIAGASVTTDIFGLWVNLNSIGANGSARQTSVDILHDPAGGTSWSVLVPNLLVGSPGTWQQNGGVFFYFPIYIPAGTSIGIRGSQHNVAPGSGYAWIRGLGRPRTPELVRAGAFVERIGASATSGGTSVTAGTASEGAWTLLGTTAERLWHWQLGVGFNDASLGSSHAVDLAVGDGSNFDIILEDVPVSTISTEVQMIPLHGDFFDVPAGSSIYARVQSSAAETTTVAAFGVGG
jgi:hypothetical protein